MYLDNRALPEEEQDPLDIYDLLNDDEEHTSVVGYRNALQALGCVLVLPPQSTDPSSICNNINIQLQRSR